MPRPKVPAESRLMLVSIQRRTDSAVLDATLNQTTGGGGQLYDVAGAKFDEYHFPSAHARKLELR